MQVRCLVDYPGEKLPSVTNGELQRYLLDVVAPQVCVLRTHCHAVHIQLLYLPAMPPAAAGCCTTCPSPVTGAVHPSQTNPACSFCILPLTTPTGLHCTGARPAAAAL